MIRNMLWLLLLVLTFFPLKQAGAHTKVHIIEMSANGFEPTGLTVDENATVLFVNKDSISRWPASNVHPTHDIYPAFDPKKEVKPGESWPLQSLKVGKWKYHDHLTPHMRGLLIVVKEKNIGENSPTTEHVKKESVLTKFSDTLTHWSSYIQKLFRPKEVSTKKLLPKERFKTLSAEKQVEELADIAQHMKAKKAWEYLKEVYKGDAGSSGNIHDLAHLTGMLLYKQEDLRGLKTCSADFSFGCYHGFLDSAFAKSLDELLTAEDACIQLDPQKESAAPTGPVASCIHGIGHGVASFYATTDIEASLKTCRKLVIGSEYCFDGVFMEFVRSAPESFFSIDDPLYPCSMLEQKFGYAYSFACGRNQPSLLMGRFRMPFEQVASICTQSSSQLLQQGCVEALSFSLAATLDPEKIKQGCQIMGAAFAQNCIQKAAGELVFQNAPNWQEKTQILCNTIPDAKNSCMVYVATLSSEYGRKSN